MVCLLHSLAKDFLPCKLDQINPDSTERWYQLAQMKINQQAVHGSECKRTTIPRRHKKCEDLKSRLENDAVCYRFFSIHRASTLPT
jgi:hypothetical protein